MEGPRLIPVLLMVLGLLTSYGAPRPNNLVLVGRDGQPGPLLVAALNLMEGRKGVDVEVEEASEIVEKEGIDAVKVRDQILPEEAFQERSWVEDEVDVRSNREREAPTGGAELAEEWVDVRSSRARGDFSIKASPTGNAELAEEGSGGDVLEMIGKMEEQANDEEEEEGSSEHTYYPVTAPKEDTQQETDNGILKADGQDLLEDIDIIERDTFVETPTTMPVTSVRVNEESSQVSYTEHVEVPQQIHEEESEEISSKLEDPKA